VNECGQSSNSDAGCVRCPCVEERVEHELEWKVNEVREFDSLPLLHIVSEAVESDVED
jgi:hypothetical protein